MGKEKTAKKRYLSQHIKNENTRSRFKISISENYIFTKLLKEMIRQKEGIYYLGNLFIKRNNHLQLKMLKILLPAFVLVTRL